MKARLKRANDSSDRPELQITLAGPRDEPVLLELSRQVNRELQAGPVKRNLFDTRDLQFNLHDQGELYCAVSAVYIASGDAERFRIIDAADRKRRLMEIVMTGK